MTDTMNKSNYGKRPLWQWILIYLVIGGIIYALIYYFFLGNKNNEYSPGNTNQPQQQNPPGY
jgi:hypothetical protein